MPSGKALLASVRDELRVGQTQLALLGNKRDSDILILDSPEAMARYADIMRASLTQAMKRNEKFQWIGVLGLVLLFVAATFLTVVAHLWNWGWPTGLITVPGLGVSAYWPIRTILDIRKENLILAMLPDLITWLPRKDVLKILDRLLSR
jgi:hypothetical protein